jgi:aminopeptidase-like protein/aminoglycoside N3'-acetyltransferase
VTQVVPAPLTAQLIQSLRSVGVRLGDTVFVQVSLDQLGLARDLAPDERGRIVVDALRQAVGPDGTVLMPTYTFSFCRQELYDVQATVTRGGPWSRSPEVLEYLRRVPDAHRSRDPIHSVTGLGPEAQALVSGLAPTCFGPGSIFDRLRAAGARICLLGLPLEEATFRHHVEEMVGVPYRFRKLFTGQIRDRGVVRREGWLYYVRILAPNADPDTDRLERLARDGGVCRAAPLGAGEVLAVDCPEFYDFTAEHLRADRWFTARGPAADPLRLEAARVGTRPPRVELPPAASMTEMINALWRLPRDLISDGYDAALTALEGQVPMRIHSYPTGLETWTWVVPEKWTCHEAYLETLDGRRLFSYADHPLHVVSYSLPFEGEVSREVLLRHLHVHSQLTDAVPFVFKYYDRDWGLCCSRRLRDTLADERYRVVIRSDFSYGTLKVGEVVVPGRTTDSIALCAHLCHPGMVNDDLTGVVVGLDVMRHLLARPTPRYTYRLLIVPETIGSVAHLSQHPELLPSLKGGLFLEMLGRRHPHALQLSFAGDTPLDRCFARVLRRLAPDGWIAPFRTLAGNDERQFNAPGVRVPMLALTRQLAPSHPEFPYREYHSSHDVPELVPPGTLEDSRDLVLGMIAALEADRVPVNRFSGEVFCSRYGIHIDPFHNPEGNRALFDIMFLIDGTRSVADIAETCGISFEAVAGTIDELRRHGLVAYADA